MENVAKQPAKGQQKAKSTQSAAKPAESQAASGPLIDAIPAEVHAGKEAQPAPTSSVPPTPKKGAATPTPIAPETPPAATASAQPESPKPAPTAKSGSGFLPLLLGGLLAGVIGFAVANLTAPGADTGLNETVARQGAAIDTLEERIATLSAPDLSGISATQETLAADLESLQATVARIEEELAALAARPTSGGGGSVAVDTSAVDAELDALRAQIAEMTGAAQAELEEARATAAAIEENAAAAAREAAARAALARVQAAMESGAPLGAALSDLEEALGQPAPDALLAASDGVPTLARLQDEFPDVARAALATARSEGVAGEETTGFGAFLRNQFDVRSTSPQEGDSVDAILSRAEAALRSGRLSDTLAEISALPEVARAEMSGWLAMAETRADAVAAADQLSTSLSDN